MKKKRIAILGITGSIGQSTIEVIRRHSDKFEVTIASAHNNKKLLDAVSDEFNIKKTFLTKNEKKSLLTCLDEDIYDILINAVSGSAGLEYSLKAIKNGKRLALANKESLVMAGHLFDSIIKKHEAEILPVDSEHSAIFQALQGHSAKQVRKLHITASGGAFRGIPLEDFHRMNMREALQHPTWSMGKKITIDSATMVNKGLEVIEAHWLFSLDYDKIEAIIHPQSIIHSMVEYVDGSIIAQMSTPSMQLPILYSLSYPDHIPFENVKTSFIELAELTFKSIEEDRYPLFFLTVDCGKEGGLKPTILNAANEAAVDLFLSEKIRYIDLYPIVAESIQKFHNVKNPDIYTIQSTNLEVYKKVKENYKSMI